MMPGKELLVTCPFCKAEKGLMQLLSTNNFGKAQRSDTKTDYMHEIFPVQKCDSCGKYYFCYDQKHREGEEITFNTGDLSYPEAKEAIEQLYLNDLDNDHIFRLGLSFLWAYNNWFFRENDESDDKKIETDEDIKVFNDFIPKLYNVVPEDNIILRSELLREMGKFNECIELLNNVDLGHLEFVKIQILKHAEEGDKKVFPILRR